MNQTHPPASPPTPASAWCKALQLKLMAALDAAWAMIEDNTDPALIRAARERARAVGDIAAMARKIVMLDPPPRGAKSPAGLSLESLAAAPAFAAVPVAPPMAAQADIARRALDKLKGGRRGRL